MKKLIAIILTLALALTMTACGASAEKTDDGTFKVAIIQQLDHSSLDEIRTAINAELAALAGEKNVTIEIKEYNGQNDTSMLNQICAAGLSPICSRVLPFLWCQRWPWLWWRHLC